MLAVPADTIQSYNTFLNQHSVPPRGRAHYHKWLRYHLDFCHLYPHDSANKNSFSAFNRKLSEKGQSESLRRQAYDTIRLYYRMIDSQETVNTIDWASRENEATESFSSKPTTVDSNQACPNIKH